MGNKLTIIHLTELISEAELITQVLLKKNIDSGKYHVGSKKEFLALIQSTSPDIILFDHATTAFKAEEALAVLHEFNITVPFLLITSIHSESLALELIDKGVTDYIFKEYPERLPRAIHNASNKFKLEKERQALLGEIQNHEHKYKSFIENGTDVVVLFDADIKPTYVTPSITRLLGYTQQEALQSDLNELLHPDDREAVLQRIVACLHKPGIPIQGHIGRLKHKDGSWRWIDATMTNLLHDPAINGIVDHFWDVTEKVTAGEELKKSEKQYKQLFQFSPLPQWIYDLSTLQFIEVNQAAISLYGYSREEFLGMSMQDIQPEADTPWIKNDSIHQKNNESIIPFAVFNHRKKNKALIRVEITGYRLTCQGKDCLMVICNDITAKETVLQQLKDREKKLVAAQKIARLGYWDMNFKDQFLYWTKETYNVWGVDTQTFTPSLKAIQQLVHPEDLENFNKDHAAAIAGLKKHNLEFRIILPDGGIKWLHGQGELVKDAQGNILYFEGTVQDITEQKIAIQQLLVSEARHRGIVQSQTNYVVRIDLEGKYSYCNDKFLYDFGWIYPEGEVVGQDSMVSIKEYHYKRVQETAEMCLSNPGKVFQVEIDKPLKNGGVKTTLWDFVSIVDLVHRPVEIQCVGIDISERIKTEQLLKESLTR